MVSFAFYNYFVCWLPKPAPLGFAGWVFPRCWSARNALSGAGFAQIQQKSFVLDGQLVARLVLRRC